MDFKLIIRKIEGRLSAEEQIIFDQWYDESESHREYFRKVSSGYNKPTLQINKDKAWLRLKREISTPVKPRYNWRYGVAASLVLLALASIAFFMNNKDDTENLVAEQVIEAGSDKAILTLADGTEVDLQSGQSYNAQGVTSNGEFIKYEGQQEKLEYHYLTIPRGGEFYMELSDSTKVWLNADTRIKYPTKFIAGQPRQVELVYGEAYFDVSPSAHNHGDHFIVATGAQKVEVLGTEFNIRAYKQDRNTTTTLVEGSVQLEVADQEISMKPKDQVTFNYESKGLSKKEVVVHDYISWKDGFFSFNESNLASIAENLNRWYDVQIVFADEEVKNIKFNGVFSRELGLNKILNLLGKTSNISYEIEDNKIEIKQKGE
ncbi:DUF4974 domain-containing protein [Fulvivirga maritima]|uniref:FecR family protein n=1 Tax=Fulvivirga maritima TaxID=2904247 RepID=UPI001F2AA584|nr:FecR domain-containing protein [Fulvivirga maritima]UII26394.1 DUF4974 domain-containing protein [Fulvivirga maritima]